MAVVCVVDGVFSPLIEIDENEREITKFESVNLGDGFGQLINSDRVFDFE